ncbi:MAG: glycosyltransferase family 4 protein [Chitinophagaceae bacterium]|nr:glycosyltransferase family 4 protein [Chitinophagaceae bacterium]
MRILIYSPPNARAVDLQSVMEIFVKKGYEVYLLTHMAKGDLHQNVEKYGVKTFGAGFNANGASAYLQHVKYLVKFVREHKIDVIFAHLQSTGLISGIARKLTPFKLFYIRHNTDEHKLEGSRNAIVINWLANKAVSKIIAISNKVSRYLIDVEKIDPSRVVRINLGYNFESYIHTDRKGVAADIRREFPAKMLLLSAARLIPVKRQMLVFETVKKMVEEKMDVKLLCLSDGPYRPTLEAYVRDNGLQDNIFLLGSKKNIIDYMEATDLFVHLSESEASNNAVKEMGYCRKTAIVCNDVGDFDDYIVNGVNGYIVDKTNPVEPAFRILKDLYHAPEKLKPIGDKLYETVVREFSIENVAPLYDKLLNPVKN